MNLWILFSISKHTTGLPPGFQWARRWTRLANWQLRQLSTWREWRKDTAWVDEWRTEWKHHGSKSIHCYQSQILNPNEKRHFSKERDNLPQGLAKLTTDKKRVSVQAWQVPGYPEYWKQQIRWGHVCDEFNLSAFLSSSFYKRSPQRENLRPVKRWWSDNR